MDRAVVLKSGQQPGLLFLCLLPLSHCYLSTSCSNRTKVVPSKWRAKGVCVCVYVCAVCVRASVSENDTLPLIYWVIQWKKKKFFIHCKSKSWMAKS